MTQSQAEPAIDPALPIIDAHHHLWYVPDDSLAAMDKSDDLLSRLLAPMYRRNARYLFDEFHHDITCGHNIVGSVFVDAHAMYRAKGPERLKSLGEVEFVTGVAAMSDSGLFGPARVCVGIVSGLDLRSVAESRGLLEEHIRAGGDRLKGIRNVTAYDDDAHILGKGAGDPHLLLDSKFQKGFGLLHKHGLSFDALVLEPQLTDVIELARSFPDTPIILNHVGLPMGIGRYRGLRSERFSVWRAAMSSLARCSNVSVKLGGLGSPFPGFEPSDAPITSEKLALQWRPYVETCIEQFGVRRCMFESNFPVDSAAGSYSLIWNTFKRIASGASAEEKLELFSGTARRVYRLSSEIPAA